MIQLSFLGLEPLTSGLTEWCANQLCHRGIQLSIFEKGEINLCAKGGQSKNAQKTMFNSGSQCPILTVLKLFASHPFIQVCVILLCIQEHRLFSVLWKIEHTFLLTQWLPLRPTTLYAGVKQQRPWSVLGWVTVVVCQFLHIALRMRL